MSKAFGLAGLRIGYAVGAPAVVAEVEKSRGPYKVSVAAERAAVAVLANDRPWVTARVAEARISRDRLAESLRKLGLAPLPSQANFVLVPVRNAADVSRRMRAHGVAVRVFEGLPSIGDALRITVGPCADDGERVDALERALSMRVTIFDYGAGNLHSLAKALERWGVERARRDRSGAQRSTRDVLVLPGVGAFGARPRALAPGRDAMRDAIRGGLPCVGICLGMQLLFDGSDEGAGAGLGVIPGRVTRLRARRVPHIGWNTRSKT